MAEVTINVAVPVRVNGPTDVKLTSPDDARVPVTLPDPGSVEDVFLNGAEEEVERISPVPREPRLVPLIVLVATVTNRPLETVVPVRIDTVLPTVPVGIKLDPLRLPVTVERVLRPVPVPVTINPVPFRLTVVIEAVILTLPVPLRLPVGMETGTLPMPVPLLPVRIETLLLPVGEGPIPELWKECAVTLNIYG